jgi:hypothetical protein
MASPDAPWSPSSWQSRPSLQLPSYSDPGTIPPSRHLEAHPAAATHLSFPNSIRVINPPPSPPSATSRLPLRNRATLLPPVLPVILLLRIHPPRRRLCRAVRGLPPLRHRRQGQPDQRSCGCAAPCSRSRDHDWENRRTGPLIIMDSKV